MKFKVGDRVRVILEGHEDNGNGPHFGVLGSVVEEAREWNVRVPYVVVRDGDKNKSRICYSEEHLEALAPQPLMLPEMELSEIEEAEYLMQELSK